MKRVFFSSDQRYLLEMYNHGYIFETGFMKSYQLKKVVFNDGRPAPWFNYSFIDFLTPKLNESLYIYEYGLGNSTKYFNKISPNCYGVEHEVAWYNEVVDKSKLKPNYNLANGEEYINAISKTGEKFDIIVVDGIHRDDCIKVGIEFLSEKGVVILDDTERNEYADSILFLKTNGFKEIRISGIKALGRHYSCTSVFYRIDNCLEI